MNASPRRLVAPSPSSLALVLQVARVPAPVRLVNGVVPNLVLLVVVAAALARGPQFGAVLGFVRRPAARPRPARRPRRRPLGAGAGLVVGYLAGRRAPGRPAPTATAVGGHRGRGSFVGTSVFALSGMLLGDPALGAGEMLQVIAGRAAVGRRCSTPFVAAAA